MQFDIRYLDKFKTVELGEKINSGSNSDLYLVDKLGESKEEDLVAKCSKNPQNYISFNLQYNSYKLCTKIFQNEVLVPRVLIYGNVTELGDIMVMERINHLYDIAFMINASLYYGDVIVKKVASAVAKLHNNGISGYDVEFYWEAVKNQLVVLDVGPMFTFNCTSEQMIYEHWEMEKSNEMGRWNIISQLLPTTESKKIFKAKEIKQISYEQTVGYIEKSSVALHVENVAKLHALYILGKINSENRKHYLDVFVKEYKKNINIFNMDNMKYISTFKQTIEKNELSACARLYYSQVDTLSQESCAICIE